MKKITNNSTEEFTNLMQNIFAKYEQEELSKRSKAGIARKKLLKTKGADINQTKTNMTTNYNEFLGFKINSELENTLEETLIQRVIKTVQIFQELLSKDQIKIESLTEYLSSNPIPGIGNFEKALNIQRAKFIVEPEDSLDETLVLAIMVYVEAYQQMLETACDEDSIYSRPKTPASTGVMSANI